MYRSQGSSGVLQGVLSGPYTGGRRLVAASKLPRAARQRLADVIGGRSEPMPIAYERPLSLAARVSTTWALLGGILALSTIIAIGFGNPNAAWALQPDGVIPIYAAIALACGLVLLAVFRRHARATGTSLVPGRYVLPLDVVEVPALDADGEQVLTVTPLGDARDARIQGQELVLVMASGEELRFPLRSERDGEAAMRRLEHAQRLLEDLSYAHDLERALAQDAFFDVRADQSWAAVAPDGTPSKRIDAVAAPSRAWLHGRAATVVVVALSLLAGFATFRARNFMSDRALYLYALRIGTPEQLDVYLERGRAYRIEAIAQRDRLEEQRTELARRASEARQKASDTSPKADWELTPDERLVRRGTMEGCVAGLRARSSPTHRNVPRILEGLVQRAEFRGDPVIPVRVFVKATRLEAGMVKRVEERARATAAVAAFERFFSEVCPASLARFVVAPEALPLEPEPGLDLRVEVTWPTAPTWKLPPNELAVYAPTWVFEVTLRGTARDETATFRLSMPPPATASMELRERSLFKLHGDAPTPGAFDERVYDVLSARAFDRLYDELWGLVFAGDPRVPLRDVDPFQ